MDAARRELVRLRAQGRCEYCHFPETFAFFPFQVDHVIAEKHHGLTVEENLAWSCYYCNTYKGPNLAGFDLETGAIVRLFHARQDRWATHFAWQGPRLMPRTAIGRVTIDVLQINHPDAVVVRRHLFAVGERLV